jgi:hypothetical protein
MATKDEIKKAILEVAGNPESGVIKEYAEAFAEAIVGLDAPKRSASFDGPAKETRETKPEEKR